MNASHNKHSNIERMASNTVKASGSNLVIILSFSLVILWALVGPIFNFSQNWLQIINTGSSIITFLMVFLIQKAQNKDYLAIQIKLNELLASHELANNNMVDIENKSEQELEIIKEKYSKMGMRKKNRELKLLDQVKSDLSLPEVPPKTKRNYTKKPKL